MEVGRSVFLKWLANEEQRLYDEYTRFLAAFGYAESQVSFQDYLLIAEEEDAA